MVASANGCVAGGVVEVVPAAGQHLDEGVIAGAREEDQREAIAAGGGRARLGVAHAVHRRLPPVVGPLLEQVPDVDQQHLLVLLTLFQLQRCDWLSLSLSLSSSSSSSFAFLAASVVSDAVGAPPLAVGEEHLEARRVGVLPQDGEALVCWASEASVELG